MQVYLKKGEEEELKGIQMGMFWWNKPRVTILETQTCISVGSMILVLLTRCETSAMFLGWMKLGL